MDAAAAEEATRVSFYCLSLRAAQTRLRAKIPVFRYLYSGNFSNVSPRPWMGVYHGSELPMLFGTHGLYRGASTYLENQTSSDMQHTWLAFLGSREFGPVFKGGTLGMGRIERYLICGVARACLLILGPPTPLVSSVDPSSRRWMASVVEI